MLEPAQPTRRRLEIRGQVQGVGFRPYVYRLALARGLCGYVANDSNGAVVEAEGAAAALDAFERDLVDQLPPLARITNLMRLEVPAAGETSFRIRTSQADSRQRP
ncbi:MAG TPA: acylphosphatase, partial [Phycisphaerae bacterium]|nr:acylphosphatase [Phycisphaerae bacterium]